MPNFLSRPSIAFALGAVLIVALALVGARASGPELAARLAERAGSAIAQSGGDVQVRALFVSPGGSVSRHPVLVGGEPLGEGTRNRIAKTVAAVAGVGGIRWSDGDALVDNAEQVVRPLHCQEDVESLLRARTIRFEESSARIDAASASLIDEVVTALRPCLGSTIAITGHTDSSGPEPGNLALSRERAQAVRDALITRGLPRDGLRVRGMGSSLPVEGLDPADPANRRIEFSVVTTEPIRPTPVDTPGPR